MGKSPYPKEFREEIVAIARKREIPIRQLAKDVDVSEPTLYEWLRKADAEDGVSESDNSVADVEVRELKRRNRQLEQELEVLRRATAYFSQAVLPK